MAFIGFLLSECGQPRAACRRDDAGDLIPSVREIAVSGLSAKTQRRAGRSRDPRPWPVACPEVRRVVNSHRMMAVNGQLETFGGNAKVSRSSHPLRT
jgi:hypothetical protein